MIITVTQEHIDAGTEGSTICCPIALALGGKANVLLEFIDYKPNGLIPADKPYIVYRCTPEMQKFIIAFDNEEQVFPQSFILGEYFDLNQEEI